MQTPEQLLTCCCFACKQLPVTMYHSSYINQTDFLNMSMTNGIGRSYKYFTGTPLFPFGFGAYDRWHKCWCSTSISPGRTAAPGSAL